MTAVVGRDRELAEIASFLDLSNGGARVLLIEGEAGIGKTTLWRAGVDEASRLGYRVLACAGAASETQLSFTAFRDVLGDSFDDIADELPPPQRHALEVALLRTEPTGRPADPGAVAVGLLGTLRLLAARGPTLLAVDDLQWIDKASAAPLEYALRRLHSERVAVLLARRADDPETLEPSGLEAGRVRPLRLSALSVGALGRVLHERPGGRTRGRPCTDCTSSRAATSSMRSS